MFAIGLCNKKQKSSLSKKNLIKLMQPKKRVLQIRRTSNSKLDAIVMSQFTSFSTHQQIMT